MLKKIWWMNTVIFTLQLAVGSAVFQYTTELATALCCAALAPVAAVICCRIFWRQNEARDTPFLAVVTNAMIVGGLFAFWTTTWSSNIVGVVIAAYFVMAWVIHHDLQIVKDGSGVGDPFFTWVLTLPAGVGMVLGGLLLMKIRRETKVA